MPRQAIEIPFPYKGLDEGWALGRQPKGTTPSALNVRPIDPSDRVRGSQRTGLAKYLDDAVNGTSPIQMIGHVSIPASVSTMTQGGLLLSETFDTTVSSDTYQSLAGYPAAHASSLTVNSSYGVTSGTLQSNPGTGNRILVWKTAISGGYMVWGKFLANENFGTQFGDAGILFRCASDGSDDLEITEFGVAFLHGDDHKIYVIFPDGTQYASTLTVTSVQSAHEIRLEDDRGAVRVYVDDVLFVQTDAESSGATNGYVGVFAEYGGAATIAYADNWIITEGRLAQQPSERRLIVVSGGTVYHGTHDDGLAAATDGDGVLNPSYVVRGVEAYGKFYFCNGKSTGYLIFDPSDDTVVTWTPTAPDVLPVANGEATGGVDTTLGASMIALYRGRIVLSGLYEAPHNWFMSAVSDPLNWDYDPDETTAIQAVAGNNSDAGKIGDVITCLAPFSDDILVFGCSQSLWLLRGDPAAGGAIDALSYQIGISGPDAATWDDSGNLYFYGTGGVWRMPTGGGLPSSLTDTRLKGEFGDIDSETYRVQLVWDRMFDGLHMFLLPADLTEPDSAPTHYYWDRRTDSWWKDQFPVGQGPSFAYYYPADNADDRAILMGGWDSYLRYYLASQKSDDGTVITSYVDTAPIVTGDLTDTRLSELQITMASGSDAALLKGYAAASPEAVVAATLPRFQRRLAAGRNPSILQRLWANALRLRIQNTGTAGELWTLETITAFMEPVGRSRRR